MFKRILLPLDGSALAECAAPHALALAKMTDAEVVVLHVLEERSIEDVVDPMEWHMRKSAAQSYVDDVCAKLQTLDAQVECLLMAGAPAERLIEQIDRLHIDLVVLSSRGQSGLVDGSFGAVTHKLLEGVTTSIMLVPCRLKPVERVEFVPALYNSVLVPLDGSRRAECVLPIAERLTMEQNTRLVLAHIVQRPAILGWATLPVEDRNLGEQLVDHASSIAESYMEQILARHRPQTTGTVAKADNVAAELNHIAEAHMADILVMSAHGAASNPLRTFGDTVSSVLASCHVPLLIYQDRQLSHPSAPSVAPLRGRLEDLDDVVPGPGGHPAPVAA
jgi:nucleotide-binding universal stress UspA family protein